MPYLDLPFETFVDLEQHGLQIRVGCHKCGQQRIVDNTDKAIRDRSVAGARFRSQHVLPGGTVCGGIGLPSIGKRGAGA